VEWSEVIAVADLYQIKTDYPILANAKAAALTLVYAHWGFVFDVKINGEPFYKRRILPNAQGTYTLTATTTYTTHPLHAGTVLEKVQKN
jgi:hypothetical protein